MSALGGSVFDIAIQSCNSECTPTAPFPIEQDSKSDVLMYQTLYERKSGKPYPEYVLISIGMNYRLLHGAKGLCSQFTTMLAVWSRKDCFISSTHHWSLMLSGQIFHDHVYQHWHIGVYTVGTIHSLYHCLNGYSIHIFFVSTQAKLMIEPIGH